MRIHSEGKAKEMDGYCNADNRSPSSGGEQEVRGVIMADLEERLRSGLTLYQRSRFGKFRQGGVRLVISKILEVGARRLGISFRRRAKLIWGEEMTVVYPQKDAVGISRYGFFEEGLTRMVLAHVTPGMTFLDIGANIGYFTLLAAWLVKSAGGVHAFEPTPATFTILERNVGKKPNVQLNRLAVGSKRGTVVLNDYGPGMSGYNSLYTARLGVSALTRYKPKKVEVSIISIDQYVAENALTPDFVKIDAESADYEILMGMKETLRKCRPIISVEVGDMDIAGVRPSKDIVHFLVENGYQPYEHNDGEIAKHTTKDRYEYRDLLFLPESL